MTWSAWQQTEVTGLPVWPASLPQFPDRDGFQESWDGIIAEQEVDTGHEQTRPRFSNPVDEYQVRFMIDRTQRATLRAFWRDELKAGALKFSAPNPITEDLDTFKIRGGLNITPVGVHFRVAFTLRRVL